MVEIVPFQADHLRTLVLQPAQQWMQPMVSAPEYLATLQACDSFAALHEGRVIAVAGLVTVWPGRAHLSALLAADIGHAFIGLHRETLRRLEALDIARVEATVDADFVHAHDWLQMLGFELETPFGMLGYMPDGRTSFLYARAKRAA